MKAFLAFYPNLINRTIEADSEIAVTLTIDIWWVGLRIDSTFMGQKKFTCNFCSLSYQIGVY